MAYSAVANSPNPCSATRIFMCVYLAMLGTCFYYLFSDIGDLSDITKAGDSITYRIVWVSLYVCLAAMAVGSFSILWNRLTIPIGLTAASLVAFAGGTVQPANAVGLLMLFMTFLFGTWAASRFSFRQFFETYYNLACIVAIIHLALYPQLSYLSSHFDTQGRDSIFGTAVYAGLFAHKNQAGLFFGIATVIGFMKFSTKATLSPPRALFVLLLFSLVSDSLVR